MKSMEFKDNTDTTSNVCKCEQSGRSGFQERSGRVWLHTCSCPMPCSGLLASVEILIFTDISSAQCGVFIIVGMFYWCLKKPKPKQPTKN